MKRNFVTGLSCAGLAALAAFTLNCGSSSNNSITQVCTANTIAADVVGDWSLSITSSGTTSSGNPGVINNSGLAVFFDVTQPTPGDTATFPAITGAQCFSGTTTSYGTPISGGGASTFSTQGNVNSQASITGSFNGSSGQGSFTMTPATPLSGSVIALDGNQFLGEIPGVAEPLIWNITVFGSGDNNGMDFTGAAIQNNGATCSISGSFNQESGNFANLNVFDATVNFGDCVSFSNFTGLGFESSSDYFNLNGNAAGTYLYAISSNSATVLEIFQPGP
ncbi:MAG TPA: hypothetical protein VND65_08885 [Candidatus Binatia bacterium]|nr:hypothetical protein [Candidatus Binatia bacterium]